MSTNRYMAKPAQPLDALAWRRVLVLVPHPDDESIGCGGLLAALDEWGIPVHLVLVTNGDGGGDLPIGTDKARYTEFCSAVKTLGRNISHEYWALPDGTLAERKDLMLRLNASITAFQPSVLLAPWLDDIHPDHKTLGELAMQLHTQSPMPQGIVFYEVWTPLPANRIIRVSPWWTQKLAALHCHQTALKYGRYERAMAGLASYRSLLGNQQAGEGEYAEAFHVVDPSETNPELQYRYAQQSDGATIERLFSSVFETAVPDGWWHWKYGGNPLPGALAVNAAGEQVAFYGALPREALFQGSRYSVCQQGDVMVRSDVRFATRTSGVFPSLSRHFLLREVGDGCRFDLAFGFPTPRALALGVRLGLYRAADRLFLWHKQVQPNTLQLGYRYRTYDADKTAEWDWVDQLSTLPPGATECFRLQRSGHYWQRRFSQHPQRKYRLIQLFRWGRLVAAAILQRQDQALELMDVALKHEKYWLPLLHSAEHYTVGQGLDSLQAWGTEIALKVFPDGILEPAGNIALPGPEMQAGLTEQVNGKCWLIGGDTDFR